MKLNGLTGTGSGKLGSSVFAVRNGAQIVRQYQPVVENPNTQPQVESRSKLKLMSQMAAVMAPVIAIPKEGLKSSRNLFIKKNYENVQYANEEAFIELNDVQLTNSVVANVGFEADRSSGTAVNVNLLQDCSEALDRVVYAMFVKGADARLRLVDSIVVTAAGNDGEFAGSLAYNDGNIVIYCYDVHNNSEAARARFASLNAPSAETVAKIVATRVLTMADITVTETAGLQMNQGTNTAQSVAESGERYTLEMNNPTWDSGDNEWGTQPILTPSAAAATNTLSISDITITNLTQGGINFTTQSVNASTGAITLRTSGTGTIVGEHSIKVDIAAHGDYRALSQVINFTVA